jgi:hypothetical protein
MAELTQSTRRSTSRAPIRYDQPWLTSLLRPVLIGLMIACIDLTILSVVARVAPFLASDYIPAMIVLSVGAAIVGCITTTWLAQPEQRHRRTFGYRMAELGLLLALTRLAIWLVTGQWPSPALFMTRPIDALLDGLFYVGGFIVTISWVMATDTTDDLLRMALQPDELYAIDADRIGEMARTSHSDRPAILRGLVGRWVTGGIVMVMFAAGLGLNLSSGRSFFTLAQQEIQPAIIAAIVIYFLAGLVLISHGQLAILRSRWTIDRVPSAGDVLRNWPLYVVLLLLLIGGLAALMPFGGTFLLAQILGSIIAFLFNLILDFFRLLTTLFLMLISLLTGEQPMSQEQPPPPPPAAPPPDLPPPMTQMPPWVGGAVFWVAMALLLGYAAYIYFSGKGVNLGWLTTLWRMLLARWAQFRHAYQAWAATRLPTVKNEGDGEQGRSGLGRWWQRRKLDPEQQVRYYYLSTLERAEQSGLVRRQAETPLQYAPRLAQRVEETMEDKQAVQTLTTAFVQARYSRRRIEATQIPRLQQIWQQIRQHLHL